MTLLAPVSAVDYSMEDETPNPLLTEELNNSYAEKVSSALDGYQELDESINADQQVLDDLHSDAETCELLETALEAINLTPAGMTQQAAQFMHVTIDRIVARVGMPSPMPSLESYGPPAIGLEALEKVKEVGKKVWEAIVAACKKIIATIRSMFSKLATGVTGLLGRIKTAKESNAKRKEDDTVSDVDYTPKLILLTAENTWPRYDELVYNNIIGLNSTALYINPDIMKAITAITVDNAEKTIAEIHGFLTRDKPDSSWKGRTEINMLGGAIARYTPPTPVVSESAFVDYVNAVRIDGYRFYHHPLNHDVETEGEVTRLSKGQCEVLLNKNEDIVHKLHAAAQLADKALVRITAFIDDADKNFSNVSEASAKAESNFQEHHDAEFNAEILRFGVKALASVVHTAGQWLSYNYSATDAVTSYCYAFARESAKTA